MIDVILEEKLFKLKINSTSPKQKDFFRRLIKEIPGYEYMKKGDCYTVPLIELKSIISILKNNVNFLDDKKGIVEKYNAEVRSFLGTLDEYNPSNFLKKIDSSKNYPFLKLPPFNFQKLAIEWLSTPKGSANIYGGVIADEVGLGKTFQSIAAVCNLKDKGICNKGIIITLANMRNQWAGEINTFCHESYRIMNPGKKEKRIKEYKEFDETFLIISYELYKRDAKIIQELIAENSNLDFSFIIIDEAHKMKTITSETYSTISLINAPVKILLTATPIKRDVDDLFALFNYLDSNILISWNYFKNKFLKFVFKFGKKIPNGGRIETRPLLHRMIAPYMLRRKSTDVSKEIPTLLEEFIPIEATKEQSKWFKILEDEMEKALKQAELAVKENKMKLAELKEKAFQSKFQAISVCSDSLKLLLCSESKSTQKLVEKHKVNNIDSPKLNWLMEFIEDNIVQNSEFFEEKKEKLVIFTQFERMTRIIEEELNEKIISKNPNAIKYMKFTGKLDKKCLRLSKDKLPINCFECKWSKDCASTEKSKFMFVKDPNVNVLICTDAAQAGLNLQVARYLINFDLPYSPGSIEQRNGRIKRIGSPYGQVKVYNLYTLNSPDENVVSKLKNRREHINVIVESNESEKEAYALHLPDLN